MNLVNKYIRTPDGIDKATELLDKDEIGCWYGTEKSNALMIYKKIKEFGYCGVCYDIKDLKISDNILDLLQPLDLLYVDIDPEDDCDGIVVPRIAETEAELDKFKERIKNNMWKLVYIVTSEQMESIGYKVNE